MSRSDSRGPKLPRGLLDQIGGNQQEHGRRGRGRHQSYGSPKGHRRAERDEKSQFKGRPRPVRQANPVGRDSDDSSDAQDRASPLVKTQAAPTNPTSKGPRSSLVQVRKPSEPEPNSGRDLLRQSRPSVSRAVKDKLEEDDADIAALEKRLGIKGSSKTSKAIQDDGLDFLLEDLSESDNDRKRQRAEYDDYIRTKRRRMDRTDRADAGELDSNSSDDMEDDEMSLALPLDSTRHSLVEDDLDTDLEGFPDEEDNDVFDGFEDDPPAEKTAPRQRENPYVAPADPKQVTTAKYIPPSLRQISNADEEVRSRLRKQVQGLLNRLSEANVLTIVRDVESLYQNNPRQYVTSTLIDLLIASLADRTRLNDTFVVLHAGFVAALYKVVGLEFGAQFVERVVADFDHAYALEVVNQDSKISANLISLVAILYIFQVITETLVLDFVRLFLRSVSETNTELLLLVVRSCGTQLRQDDPTSLKDIVAILHSAAAEVGESNLSVRTRFMIETVNNLKNNRAKAGATASAVVGEHITRMKKAIGSLPARRATEPFGLSLSDLRDADKKGKWWLVGASWKGLDKQPKNTTGDIILPEKDSGIEAADGETDLLVLARDMGMNTEIRRAVFISIMSASDVKDAQVRISKLHLKKAQELEIPRVLLKCVGAEKNYNQYYALIAQRLCSQDRRLQKAFQFSLWDLFRRLGEKYYEDDDVDEENEEHQSITTRQLVNFGKMFGTLMMKGAMPVSALKVLSFGMLKAKTTALLEVLFATIFRDAATRSKSDRQSSILSKVAEDVRTAPDMLAGLQLFLEQILEGDTLRDGQHGKAMRRCCRTLIEALRRFEGSDGEIGRL